MRDDTLTPSDHAVERLLAARVAHGDSPHTVRALRGDLDELCDFLAQQGMTPETCGSEPLHLLVGVHDYSTRLVDPLLRDWTHTKQTQSPAASAR